jgi:hypothetical protein
MKSLMVYLSAIPSPAAITQYCKRWANKYTCDVSKTADVGLKERLLRLSALFQEFQK